MSGDCAGQLGLFPLTLSPPNTLLSAKFLVCFNCLKVLQCRSKLEKMSSECQTAWIWMRRWVTRPFIRMQAVWHSDNIFTNFVQHWSTLKIEADEKFSRQQCIWQAKGQNITKYSKALRIHPLKQGTKCRIKDKLALKKGWKELGSSSCELSAYMLPYFKQPLVFILN